MGVVSELVINVIKEILKTEVKKNLTKSLEEIEISTS